MAWGRFGDKGDFAPEPRSIYDDIAASRGCVPCNSKALRNSSIRTSKMSIHSDSQV
jgi:hypothetical protein